MATGMVSRMYSAVRTITNDSRLTANALVVSFSPVAAILANMLYFGSPALGIVATLLFFLIGGYSIQKAMRSLGNNIIIRTSVGAFVLLTVMVIPASVFVIFYNFNSAVFAGILIAGAIFVSYIRIHAGQRLSVTRILELARSSRGINYTFSHQRLAFIVVFIFAALIIADSALLLSRRDIPSSLVQEWFYARPAFSLWDLIPFEHAYLFFALPVLVLLAIRFLSHNLAIVLAIIFSITMELAAAFVVPTIYVESDPWYMIAEVNQNIHDRERLTLSDVLLGDKGGTLTLKVGPFEIPTVLVTGWARGMPNALAIFFVQSTGLTPVQIWPFLGAIMIGFFLRVLIYALTESLSNNKHIALLAMFALSMSSVLFITGLVTIKSTVALPFVLIGLMIGIWQLKKGKRISRSNVIFTLLNVFNYSLYFVFFLQSLFVLYFLNGGQVIRRFDLMVYFPIVTALLTLLLSIFDRLLSSGNINLYVKSVEYFLSSIASWILRYVGLTITSGGEVIATTPRVLIIDDPTWVFANTVYLALLIYGVLSFKKMRLPAFNFFFWVFVIAHLTTFIATYVQYPPSSLGLRGTYIESLMEIPFIATGIWSFMRFLEGLKAAQIILPIFAVLIAFPVVAAITTDPQYYWPSRSDVEAVEYLVRTDSSNFSVATLPIISNVVHAYTDGRLIAGGFDTPDAYAAGNAYQDLVGNYMTITREPTDANMQRMLEDTKSCNVYVLVSSNDPVSKNAAAVDSLSKLMQERIEFTFKSDSTYLLRYSRC